MTPEINPKLLDVVELIDRTSKQRFHGTTVEWLGGAPERVLVEVSNEEGVPLAFVSSAVQELTRVWEVSTSLPAESKVSEAQHHFENGLLLLQNGLIRRAKQEFSRSFSIDPSFRGSLLHVANDLGAKGIFDAAVFVYDLLLELSPEYSLARENLAVSFVNRGIKYAQHGLIPQGIGDFNQALMVKPSERTTQTARSNLVAAYTQLGIFHSSAKQYQLAYQCFQLALEIEPSDTSRSNLAVAMIAISTVALEKRSRESMEAIFKQPLLMGLTRSQCLTAYGATVAGLDDIAEAKWAFEVALASDPTNDVARRNLEALSRRELEFGRDILPGLIPVPVQPLHTEWQ
jgi:lipoprotein NlpI